MEKALWIVTLKLPKQEGHNPASKRLGRCPLALGTKGEPTARVCTDTTGAHHSLLVRAANVEAIRKRFENWHVTRIEQVRKFETA